MATDERISDLPANPGVATGDLIEVIDVSNTTNQATGENTKATIAQLAAAIGGGGGSGTVTNIATGVGLAGGPITTTGTISLSVPVTVAGGGTGLAAMGSPLQVLRVNAGGTALEYATPTGTSGGTVTSVATGTGLTGGPITAAGTIALAVPVAVANGGTGLTAMGTALQVLRVNSGATGLEFATPAVVTPGGAGGDFQLNNSGAFGGGNLKIGAGSELILPTIAGPTITGLGQLWCDTNRKVLSTTSAGMAIQLGGVIWQALSVGTAIANTTTPSSIFAGVTTSIGSLTIPAGALTAGKNILLGLCGTISTTGSPSLTIAILLGSTPIASSPATVVNSPAGNGWLLQSQFTGYQFQAVGAAGKVIGCQSYSTQGVGTIVLPSGTTGNNAPVQVSVDTTAALLIDLRFTWSVASASNSIQLTGGWIRMFG